MPLPSERLGGVSASVGKFAFDGDFKVAFGGAFGEDGQSGLATDFHTEFEVNFFDFDAFGESLECADDLPAIGADGAVHVFEMGLDVFGEAVGFAIAIHPSNIRQFSRIFRLYQDGIGGTIDVFYLLVSHAAFSSLMLRRASSVLT